MSGYDYWKLIAKSLLDRRACSGSTEFVFRPRRGTPELYAIDAISRDNDFRTSIYLRRGTSDSKVFSQIFADNDYNLRRLSRWNEIRGIYDGLVAQATTPLILDCGANIGLAALYFAKNWPRAHIVAVEPQDGNYHLLCRNLAGRANLQPVKAAVGSEDGIVKIANPDAVAWTFQTERAAAGSTETVKALSIQSLMSQAPAGPNYRPFIAKIDIEGFESDLFLTNTDWVDLFPLIIIELHDWMLPRQGTSNAFLRAIAPLDRDFVQIGENTFSIANRRS